MEIAFWYWWVLGVILMIVEIVAPGAFFIWLALAAFVTGFLVLPLPSLVWDGGLLDWQIQLLIFAVLSVVSVVLGHTYVRRRAGDGDDGSLNRGGGAHIGRVVTLSDPVVNGRGRARIGDSYWTVKAAEEMGAGTSVRVVAADGAVLEVVRSAPPAGGRVEAS